MTDKNIENIKSLIVTNCDDHTPFMGACTSCGRYDNFDRILDTDKVLEHLLEIDKTLLQLKSSQINWISINTPPEVAYDNEKNKFLAIVSYKDTEDTIPVYYQNGKWFFHGTEEEINTEDVDEEVFITHYAYYPSK